MYFKVIMHFHILQILFYLYLNVLYEHTAINFVNGMPHNEFRQALCGTYSAHAH